MSSRVAAQVASISRSEPGSKAFDALEPGVEKGAEMVLYRCDSGVGPRGHASKAAGDLDGFRHGQGQRRDVAAPVAYKSTEGVRDVSGMAPGHKGARQVESGEGTVALDGLRSRGEHAVLSDAAKRLRVAGCPRPALGLAEQLESLGNRSGKVDEQMKLGTVVLTADFCGCDHVNPAAVDLVYARLDRSNEVVVGDGDDIEPSQSGLLEDLFGGVLSI